MTKPTIGIYTTFYELNSSYSLSSVVESQLNALVKNGYKTVLFVHDNFKSDELVPKGVEVRKVVPRFKLVDYAGYQEIESGFQNQVDKIEKSLKENTSDIDIMLTHDLMLQGWFLPYCVAVHNFSANSKIKWFHWIHSIPNLMPVGVNYPHNLRHQLPNNSKIVTLNNFQVVRVAESYQTFPANVRVVYNAVDPRMLFATNPLVQTLVEKYDLLSADYMQTYPVSTPRMMDGKQLGVVIEIFAQLKKMGKKVKLVICNAHANNAQEKNTITEALSFAFKEGLTANEIIFTSLEEAPKHEHGVSREVVSQLMLLSNIFIFPTISENCPLILLEAMASKNLLVLNESLPQLREFGQENAFYFKFGSIHESVSYTNRSNYMSDVAKIINSEMKNNKALKANRHELKNFNYDQIFREQIEPLFYERDGSAVGD